MDYYPQHSPPVGGSVADTLNPLSRSAAESSRIVFSLWTYSPLVTDYPGLTLAV